MSLRPYDIEATAVVIANTISFKQFIDPNNGKLDDDLVSSGRNIVEHPLLNEDNLRAIAPDFSLFGDYPIYAPTNDYSTGERVTNATGDTNYESLIDNNLGFPLTDTNAWRAIDFVSDYLREKRLEAARRVIVDTNVRKKTDRKSKQLLDRMLLFSGVGRIADKIIKKNQFVGFELDLQNSNSLKLVIDRIGLQLDTDQTLQVYLFHSTQSDPVKIFNVEGKAGTFKFTDVNADDDQLNVLPYEDYSRDIAGGRWFLGYYEEDLIGQAVRYRFTFGHKPCASCNRTNLNAYRAYSRFVRVKTFSVQQANYTKGQLWDIQSTNYNTDTNWGMNLNISSYCDLTDFIQEQKDVYGNVTNMQLQAILLHEMAATTRQNQLSEKIREKAREELVNEELAGGGLRKRVDDAKDGLAFELSDIQKSACMPCEPSMAPRFKPVRI